MKEMTYCTLELLSITQSGHRTSSVVVILGVCELEVSEGNKKEQQHLGLDGRFSPPP
jgi:hypothetical protein